MSKPMVHAESTAKRFGGKASDYIDIHELIDSSRGAYPDLRHRALTHNTWFITVVVPRIFGEVRTNSDGKQYSVREAAEHHILEDFGRKFIPSVQDFLSELPFQNWMDNGNGEPPPSHIGLRSWQETRKPILSHAAELDDEEPRGMDDTAGQRLRDEDDEEPTDTELLKPIYPEEPGRCTGGLID